MIEIIQAKENHIEDIGKLFWEFIIFPKNIDPIWTPNDNAISCFIEDHLNNFMKSENCLVLVALDDSKTVGYSLSEIKIIPPGPKRDDYGYIDQMAIIASYRHKGIGEKMYAEILNWFRSKGIKRIEVGTTARNNVANSFWQKQGFTIFMYTLYKEI
ncbi:MAG: GNAT family N-acetyltransferase [Dehalococcoidales bacterium]